jgi:hypothetical protein
VDDLIKQELTQASKNKTTGSTPNFFPPTSIPTFINLFIKVHYTFILKLTCTSLSEDKLLLAFPPRIDCGGLDCLLFPLSALLPYPGYREPIIIICLTHANLLYVSGSALDTGSNTSVDQIQTPNDRNLTG